MVSALITNVLPNGLNVRVCGFFDGTVELAHLAIGDKDVDDVFKVGKRVSLAFSALDTPLTCVDPRSYYLGQCVYYPSSIRALFGSSHPRS